MKWLVLLVLFVISCGEKITNGSYENEKRINMEDVCDGKEYFWPNKNLKHWTSYLIENNKMVEENIYFEKDKGLRFFCDSNSINNYWLIYYD